MVEINPYRLLCAFLHALLPISLVLRNRILSNDITFVTRSDKKGLIAHDRKSNFFTQIQSYMNALLDFSVMQTWPVITGLLLLVAYSWPSGDSYKQFGVFMAPWEASSELCVLVKSRGAG